MGCRVKKNIVDGIFWFSNDNRTQEDKQLFVFSFVVLDEEIFERLSCVVYQKLICNAQSERFRPWKSQTLFFL